MDSNDTTKQRKPHRDVKGMALPLVMCTDKNRKFKQSEKTQRDLWGYKLVKKKKYNWPVDTRGYSDQEISYDTDDTDPPEPPVDYLPIRFAWKEQSTQERIIEIYKTDPETAICLATETNQEFRDRLEREAADASTIPPGRTVSNDEQELLVAWSSFD